MTEKTEFLKKLQDSKNLLDVLMAFEDFMDTLDLYSYKNWFEGEIVEGPIVRRYWVTIILRYPHKLMPDPQGGMRLIKRGAKVKFIKAKQELYKKPEDQMQAQGVISNVPMTGNQMTTGQQANGQNAVEPEYADIWLVSITIPRRFVEDVIDAHIEEFEDELDADDVSDAMDQGITPETEVTGDDNTNMEDNPDNQMDNAEDLEL